jgi:hypothetical protein
VTLAPRGQKEKRAHKEKLDNRVYRVLVGQLENKVQLVLQVTEVTLVKKENRVALVQLVV